MRRLTTFGLVCGLTLFAAPPAFAQLNGMHTLGDSGVLSGTQPAPGLYAAMFYYRYDTTTLKDKNGATVGPNAGEPASVTLNAYTPIFWYVSPAKLAGATVGAFVTLPFVNSAIEAPAFGFADSGATKYTDMLAGSPAFGPTVAPFLSFNVSVS